MTNMVVYFMILLALFSCQNEGEVKIERYSNGNLKYEIFYLSDSVKHGLAKTYYYEGVIKEEIEFTNGKREGKYINYHKNGSIKGEAEYSNDKVEGYSYYYNEQGALMTKSFWYNGKKFGPTSFYRENGLIRKFVICDFDEKIIYIINWNEDGKKIKEEGLVFGPTIYKQNSTNGDSICLVIAVSQPPGYKSIIRVKELREDKVIKESAIKVVNSLATYCVPRGGNIGYSIKFLGEIREIETDYLVMQDSIMQRMD